MRVMGAPFEPVEFEPEANLERAIGLLGSAGAALLIPPETILRDRLLGVAEGARG